MNRPKKRAAKKDKKVAPKVAPASLAPFREASQAPPKSSPKVVPFGGPQQECRPRSRTSPTFVARISRKLGKLRQPCPCDSCPPSPELTCSYIGEDQFVEDAYLANAYRGNLFLTPGDASGVIGGLLHSLDPPQHYSHMGIIVANHDLVRHCTMSQDRLTTSEYYSGSMLGVPAPLDGLDVDHAQYGWPGTITQSVYQAFFAARYGTGITPPGHSGPYKGSFLPDPESTHNNSYLMNQLGFDPVSDDGDTWYPPLIVKLCPFLQTQQHTEALDRIVQAALSAYAHYRFFAYTDGVIGGESGVTGASFTVPVAQPDFDPSTGRWADWATSLKTVTTPTIPACCSSFAWQMVQNSVPPGGPKIILDWANSHLQALGEYQGKCIRSVPPLWQADSRDKATRDGLYLYSEGERILTANSLHDNLAQLVYDKLKAQLHNAGGVESAVASVLDDVGRDAFIIAAGAGVAALSSLLGPLVATAGYVVDAVFLSKLIELLKDMPEDIANQMCNLFAFDCARGFPADAHCVDAKGNQITDVDSDNWSSAPGPGRAVSPDNIHMFWDAPGIANSDIIQGLYGYNVPAKLCVGVFNRPICALVPSTGVTTLIGSVFYSNKPVAGAYVSAACQYTLTSGERMPRYSLKVHSGGQYKVIARYEDLNTGMVLYGEAVTGDRNSPPLQPNTVFHLNIQVIEPPPNMRNVVIQGVIRCDDVQLTTQDNGQQSFQTTLFVQYGAAVFDIASGTWKIDIYAGRPTDTASVGYSVGDSNASVQMSAYVYSDYSVDVTLEGLLNPGDDNMSTGKQTFHVSKDQTINLTEADLDTGGAFPDRAYFRGFTIANNAVSAI